LEDELLHLRPLFPPLCLDWPSGSPSLLSNEVRGLPAWE